MRGKYYQMKIQMEAQKDMLNDLEKNLANMKKI